MGRQFQSLILRIQVNNSSRGCKERVIIASKSFVSGQCPYLGRLQVSAKQVGLQNRSARPTSTVPMVLETWRIDDLSLTSRALHFATMSLHLSVAIFTDMDREFRIKPRNRISCDGTKHDFSLLIIKPSEINKVIADVEMMNALVS